MFRSEVWSAIEELQASIHNLQTSFDNNFQVPNPYSFPQSPLPSPLSPAPNSRGCSSTPRTPPNPPLSNLPIRRLGPAEIEDLNDRGLCYNCEQTWSDTHRCRSKYLILFDTDEEDEFDDHKSLYLTAEAEVTVEDSDTLLDSESPPPPMPSSPISSHTPHPHPSLPTAYFTYPSPTPITQVPIEYTPHPSMFHPPPPPITPPRTESPPPIPPPPTEPPHPIPPPPIEPPPHSQQPNPNLNYDIPQLTPLPEIPSLTTPPLFSTRSSPVEINEKREQLLSYGAVQKCPLLCRRHSHTPWLVGTMIECDSDSPERAVHDIGDAALVGILANPRALSSSFNSRLLQDADSIHSYEIQVLAIISDDHVTLGGEPPPEISLLSHKSLSALSCQSVGCLCVSLVWMSKLCTYVGANTISHKACLISVVKPYQMSNEIEKCIKAKDGIHAVFMSLPVVLVHGDNLGKDQCLDDLCSRNCPEICLSTLSIGGNRAIVCDSRNGQQVLLGGEPPPEKSWYRFLSICHRGSTRDASRISFDLDKSSVGAIDCWFKFAIAIRLQTLELKLLESDGGMNFIDLFFLSYLGIGDPNQEIEEERWKLIGQYIASNGGVVTAEELAPYIDVESTEKTDDDSYIPPVLLWFDGQPEVDEEGNILYRFSSLQRTVAPQRRGRKPEGICWENMGCVGWRSWKNFKEKKWQFSKTSASERAMVIGLGGLNLLGLLFLAPC